MTAASTFEIPIRKSWRLCLCVKRIVLQDTAGKTVVGDVLEHGVPNGVDAVDDTSGPEGDWCNEPCEIQANRQLVCDGKSAGILEVRQVATNQERHEPDGVCAEDTCRCWTILAAASGGADEMGHVHGSGATGREESVRPCGSQSSVQSHGDARFSPILHGIDRVHLGQKTHSVRTLNMEMVPRRLGPTWKAMDLSWKLDDFSLAAICYVENVVLVAAETMVSETIQELEPKCLTVGAGKTHRASFSRMENCSLQVDGELVMWEEVGDDDLPEEERTKFRSVRTRLALLAQDLPQLMRH